MVYISLLVHVIQMPVGNYVFSTVNVLVVSGVFQINSLYGIHYLDLVIR